MKRLFSFLMVALFSATMFADTWTVVGESTPSLGLTWDQTATTNDMAQIGETNHFYKVLSFSSAVSETTQVVYKIVKDHAWTTTYPNGSSNAYSNVPAGTQDVLFVVNPSDHKYNAFGSCALVGEPTTLFKTWAPAEATVEMTFDPTSGLYKREWSKVALSAGTAAFKVVKNKKWDEGGWPSSNKTFSIESDGKYDIEITFNPFTEEVAVTAEKKEDVVVRPAVKLHGDFTDDKEDNWADTEEFELSGDKNTASLKMNLPYGTYYFGVKLDGSWRSNGSEFKRGNKTHEVVAGEGNCSIFADVAGEYTFTWTYETNTLVVGYPDAETRTMKVYFVNHNPEWVNDIYAHVYSGSFPLAEWPGTEMKKEETKVWEKDLYSFSFSYVFPKVIFHNWNGSESTDQTKELTWDPAKPYYCDGEWYADIASIPEIEPAKYYISGIGGWDEKQVKATADSYTFSNLAAGEYKLKVLPTGSWSGTNKGYDDLTAKHNGLYKDNDGNVCFQLTATANVTVTYVDGETFTVTSETPAAFKTHTLKLVPRKWATDGHKFAAWVWQRNGDLVIRNEFTDFFAGTGDTLTVETSLGLDSVQYVCLASSVKEPNWNEGSVLYGASDTISYNAGKVFTMIRDWEGTYEVVEPGDFYIIGSENLVGAGGWSNIAFPVTGTSYKFEGLAAGQDYSMKVYDWGTYLGYDDLNNKSNAGIRTDGNGNIIFRLKTAGDVTVTYDPANSIFTVAGNFTQVPVGILFDGAEEATYFNIANDNLTASLALNSIGTDYKFKLIIDADTLSKANSGDDFGIWRDYNHVEAPFAKNLTEQLVLHAPMPGTYTLTYTYADDQLVVAFPELPDPVYYIYGDFCEWELVEANQMTLIDGVYTVEINLAAGKTYEFKVNKFRYEETVTYGATDISNAMTYLTCTNWDLVAPGENINLMTQYAGNYKFKFNASTLKLDVVYPAETPTGVDNAEAGVKAVKTLENGMLIIEKNGVRYNAQGQVIK